MLRNKLVNFLKENNIDYLLVNSTNEFLVEYNELEQNARYYLTGFSGSTGEALLDKNGNISLFVDGRYHKQADIQSYKNVEIIKLALGESFLTSFVSKLEPKSRVALVTKKISLSFYEKLFEELKTKNIEIVNLDKDYVFEFIEKKESKVAKIIDVPIEIVGQSSVDKIKNVQDTLNNEEALLVTNLEQVAWLLNKRSFAQNFSSTFKAKMIIEKNLYKVFYENELNDFNEYLKTYSKKYLYSAKNISYGDYLLIKNNAQALIEDDLAILKSIKNEAEIEHLKKCFEKTDNVVLKISEIVNSATSLTEQQLVKIVEDEFFAQGATSLSFNTILASGKNSALAHYSTDMNAQTKINTGDLVLLDCGAYFEGGYSTDITRVFCLGEPSNLAKKIYTTVLKANLNAYNIQITENLSGFDIDSVARNIINEAKIDGFNFNHSTGHGVGISVHEFPPSISPTELAKTPLLDGQVFTIEPGMYNPDFGGVRLENTVYFKNGKIQSFSKMRFEEKLIDKTLLNDKELIWLEKWQAEAI